MAGGTDGPITQLLNAAAQGDDAARNRVWSAVIDEMRRLARAQLANEGAGCRLQPTSLIDEAYMKLVGKGDIEWSSRRHFWGAAAKAMRQILVDDARTRGRLKRGAGKTPEPLPAELPGAGYDVFEVLAVDEALRKLEQDDPARAEIVHLRYFAGLSVKETAAALDVSSGTVDTGWRFARAWIRRELSKGDTRTHDGLAGDG